MKSQGLLQDEKIIKILKLVWEKKLISRVEIATTLNLDKSTVTKAVNELTEAGILMETLQGTSGPLGGRRPVYLEITGNFACVGGIEINPDGIVCCLLNLQGKMLFSQVEKITPRMEGGERVEDSFARGSQILTEKANELNIKLVGIGVGLPALLSTEKGQITYSLPLMIQQPMSIVSTFSEIAGLPVLIENDARCCCFSEIISSMATSRVSDVTNMIFVLTEYRAYKAVQHSPKNLAVGLGLVLNSQILKGPDDSAGEFRSMLWEEGNKGQFCAGEGNLSSIITDNEELHSVFFELSQHIAFLVNTLNLSTVYLGGVEKSYLLILKEYIQDRIKIQWSYQNERNIEIKMASFGENAVAHGAASMYLSKLFSIQNNLQNSAKNPSILSLIH